MAESLNNLLKYYNKSDIISKVNYNDIPVTLLTPTTENAIYFNRILTACKERHYHRLERTKSGGISLGHIDLPAFDLTISKLGFELVILNEYMYRIQFRASIAESKAGKKMSGTTAFHFFKKLCKKFNIDLDDYAIENGEEVKKTIPKPFIKLSDLAVNDYTYNNVNHIDFHSSYPAGLINTHPEFRPVIEWLYDKRKEDDLYKATLNYSIGYMQSRLNGYKQAHLSKDAITDNNKRVEALAKELEENGCIILLYNTDGIWYQGKPYHSTTYEGKKIGDWSNDHINVKFRMKSAGAYEFIEDGKYTAVVRGNTTYDWEKPRELWQWGDIYKGSVYTFLCSFEEGIQILRQSEGEEYYGEEV